MEFLMDGNHVTHVEEVAVVVEAIVEVAVLLSNTIATIMVVDTELSY